MLKDNQNLQLDKYEDKYEDKDEDKQEDMNISYKELDEKCDKIILKIKIRKNKRKSS